MKIVFVSNCDVDDNSAIHIINIAIELTGRGHACVMVVPNKTVPSGRADIAFPILSYAEVVGGDLPDVISGVDLIHAWTPREHVRKLALRLQALTSARIIVHMEDNEEQIIADHFPSLSPTELLGVPDALFDKVLSPGLSHPRSHRRFIEGASAYTCLIERLLEFAPKGMPAAVFWPGFEQQFFAVPAAGQATRRRYGIKRNEIVILYSGNIHKSVLSDVRNLYLALALLRERGHPIILLKTGRKGLSLGLPVKQIDEFVIDFGFVPRSELPGLMSVADILIQPGASSVFNDYRFPGKLPEYLASGRPVILPDTNVGSELEDGRDVLKLSTGSIDEIADKVERLVKDPGLARALGLNASTFASKRLTWRRAVEILEPLYQQVIAAVPPIASTSSLAATSAPATPARMPADGDAAPGLTGDWLGEALVKMIAFYSPRFSSIGGTLVSDPFAATDWIDVLAARPLFSGHNQPNTPGELGCYDHAITENFLRHIALARAYGIYGFCFDYHWLNGRHMFQRLVDAWIHDERFDFPFCVCWTNDSWEERGPDGSRLVTPQDYSKENDTRIIDSLAPLLQHPHSLRIDGVPLLLVSNVAALPDAKATASRWRERCRQLGILKVMLVSVQPRAAGDPRDLGFDAAVDVPPVGYCEPIGVAAVAVDAPSQASLEDYRSIALASMHQLPVDYVRFRGIMAGWDDTPRRGRDARIFLNGSPAAYADWLRYLVREAVFHRRQRAPLLFINAWNRWAQGARLEPDQRDRAYLRATWDAYCEGIRDQAVTSSFATADNAAATVTNSTPLNVS